MDQKDLFPDEEPEPRPELSQWYTPAPLARRIVEWVLWNHPKIRTVLEPSAGRGAFVRPFLDLSPSIGVMAVDIDANNVRFLREMGDRVCAIHADFLKTRVERADITVGNPPYENDNDSAFIRRAFDSSPVVVMLLRGVIKHGLARWTHLWRYVNIIREVNLIERPSFGGEFTPMQDFVILELEKREFPRERGESLPIMSVEWW